MSEKPFTQINLTEVKDLAPDFGLGEFQQTRFANDALETEQTGISHQKIGAGQRPPFAHKHEDAEEVYVVIAGGGRIKLDDEVIEVARLDAIRVAAGVTRGFEAGPEGMELIAVGARHEGDGELVQEWWTD